MPHDQAYLQAEKKIEEARRSGATELDLQGNEDFILIELTESIGQLEQLLSLNLANNQLIALPESLNKLTRLQSLNLSGNRLQFLKRSIGQLTQLQELNLYENRLGALPDSLGQFTQLRELNLSYNRLTSLPESLGQLRQLQLLHITGNKLNMLPEWLGNLVQLTDIRIGGIYLEEAPKWLVKLVNLKNLDLGGYPVIISGAEIKKTGRLTNVSDFVYELTQLTVLDISGNQISEVSSSISNLVHLEQLKINYNNINDLPLEVSQLTNLKHLKLDGNPLKPELAEAYKQGTNAVKLYLRAGPVVPIYEAKLILVGEGEVGKTCLLDALLDKEWQEHPSTHGIEIQQIKVTDSETQKEITLNGWDFGGQRIYRPTHQLFFSAPAVYLVVWKPREGPQQGFVKEWIQLIKRREPSAKIIVVATHGGPQQRQPDIDRQELWDLFGKETVVDFFFVDSKPDKEGKRRGIEDLKLAIARVAAELPEVGRSVPKSFADVRKALQKKNLPYLSLDEVLAICRENKMDAEIANLFIRISHRLGHITHYENDPILSDIVILRPDWLSTAMSYVLDDEETRQKHGLVNFSRLSQLWNDPIREEETRYSENLHKIFLKLMERFDLSYRVAGISRDEEKNPVSLIAQLVPDNRPENDIAREWVDYSNTGNIQQIQTCRIVDSQSGQSANAEGLFYQLIVRLHKYSLGRINYNDSVHWQRGLILEDEYKSRAFLEHIGNDVKITVRAPYPEGFLGSLTREIKYLVEGFWEGLRCDVMVPCVEPCGRNAPGTGLYTVSSLIESKREGQPKFPCPTCNKWQNIDSLLRNAPAAQPISLESLQLEFALIKDKLNEVNSSTLRVLSQIDKSYNDLLQVLTDEAKEGPRLFSLFPLDGNKFNPKNWIRHQFRLVLWCEHSRRPLPVLNNGDMTKGVYDFELDQEWFKKAAPYLKLVTGTLSLVLPVASSTLKVVDDAATKAFQAQFDLGKDVIDAIAGEGTLLNEFSSIIDSANIERGVEKRAENATLRELHALLKAKDPGFGGLVRVMNKRNEFLWVHENFASEY